MKNFGLLFSIILVSFTAIAAAPLQAPPAPPAASEVTAATKTEETATSVTIAEAPMIDEKPKGKYEGMWTFDWKRLTKCQIVGPVTNAMLIDPKNVCKKFDKETGSPASCKLGPKSEYLIFKTLDDCKVEYEEQLKASP
ncbi:MAG: hypothetical protein V4760_06145 [Bdellovibrionota bacterium]